MVRPSSRAPDRVAVLDGFTALDGAGLQAELDRLGLAMDLDDLKFLQNYFRDWERRDPTITEVRGTWMEQALISSLSSSSGSSPRFLRSFVPMVAISIRVWGR